jgi:hypothetical protein
MLALGSRQIEEGKVIPAKEALQRIRRRTPIPSNY